MEKIEVLFDKLLFTNEPLDEEELWIARKAINAATSYPRYTMRFWQRWDRVIYVLDVPVWTDVPCKCLKQGVLL